MVEHKIKGNKILFYDDIKECPITAFTQFKKYLTIHLAIDPQPTKPNGYFDEFVSKIAQFVDTDSKEHIIQELKNFRQSVFARISELDVANLAIASIVHSINGELNNFKTEDDLQKISDEYLSKAKVGVQQEIIEHVKKNFLMV